MTIKSTHLIKFNNGGLYLAKVCGKYCRVLSKKLFGGDVKISQWKRLPNNIDLIPCVDDMVEVEGSGMMNTSDNLR